MPRASLYNSDDADSSDNSSRRRIRPRSSRSHSQTRSKRLSLGLKILKLFSPPARTVRVIYDRPDTRSRERAHIRSPSPVFPRSLSPRRASSMSPPRRPWVPLPPKIPQTPPPNQRTKPFYGPPSDHDDDESDDGADYEVRTPTWASPSLGPQSPNRGPRKVHLKKHPRIPFDEPEIIEVAPDSGRRDEDQILRVDGQAWRERQERFRNEDEARMQYEQALAAHRHYQEMLNGQAYHSHQVERENRRLRDERDQALQRLKLAEVEADQARRANALKQRQDRLDAEVRQPQQPQPRPAPLLFQEPPGPVREPGLDALHRAQQDAARTRQNEELRQRNRARDHTRGVRRGSPVRWDDLDARRDRRR